MARSHSRVEPARRARTPHAAPPPTRSRRSSARTSAAARGLAGSRLPASRQWRCPVSSISDRLAEHHADFGVRARRPRVAFRAWSAPRRRRRRGKRRTRPRLRRDAEVLRPRLAERVGADVPHAAVGEERPHRRRRVVGRAVVDDEQFPVGEGLREHRLDRFRQEPGVVLRGHHDGDGGVLRSIRSSPPSRSPRPPSRCRTGTSRSAPAGSRPPVPRRASRCRRRCRGPAPRSSPRLASPNASSAHEPDAQLRDRLLHDLHLGRAGDEHGEVLRQRDAGDEVPGGRDDVIRVAAFDAARSAAARGRTGTARFDGTTTSPTW